MFEKMNLSGEYQRLQVVTDDVRAFSIVNEIMRCNNNRDLDRTEELLVQLDKYIFIGNPINKQYKERIETIIKLRKGNISIEQAKEQFVKILEYTVPYYVVIKNCAKYLTNVELQIVLDIAKNFGKTNINVVFEALMKLCKQMEKDEGILEHIAVWESIMLNIANVYGEIGEYEKSNFVSINTIKEDMYCYRMNLLEYSIYNIAWNMGECRKKNIPVIEGYQEDYYIKKSIALCQLNKNIVGEMIAKNRVKTEY